jgi:hypothetical protein
MSPKVPCAKGLVTSLWCYQQVVEDMRLLCVYVGGLPLKEDTGTPAPSCLSLLPGHHEVSSFLYHTLLP